MDFTPTAEQKALRDAVRDLLGRRDPSTEVGQPLDDDPYLSRSKPYVYTMFLVMRQFGALEAVANFENLLDVRQTDYAPLVRPAPMTGGRWTTDAWAPIEGFMANVALRYRW